LKKKSKKKEISSDVDERSQIGRQRTADNSAGHGFLPACSDSSTGGNSRACAAEFQHRWRQSGGKFDYVPDRYGFAWLD
jgi:hypothetical protein